MNRIFLALLLLFPGVTALAQSPPPPEPFYVGSYGFSPEWDDFYNRTHYVQGVRTPPANYEQRLHFLGNTQFELARDLGLNMIGVTLYPDSVLTEMGDENVVHEICDAAWPMGEDPIYVGVFDDGIGEFFAGERIMLNPESELDFNHRGNYTPQFVDGFDNIPIAGSNLAKPLTSSSSYNNAVKIEAGRGEISGVLQLRKHDLSMFREYGGVRNDSASGLYILSVVVDLETTLNDPADTTTLMNLIITTPDSTNRWGTPLTLNFPLRACDFFDASGSCISDPVEIVLGRIEVHQAPQANPDSIGVAHIINPDAAPSLPSPAWSKTGQTRFSKILDLSEYHDTEAMHHKLDGIDIRISYGYGSAEFLLDAVCLTTPRTFAIFHQGHRIFDPSHPWGLDRWADMHFDFRRRLDALLSDLDTTTGAFPNLRFIGGPEQLVRSARWAMSSVAQCMIRERAGAGVSLYCATGASEPPAAGAAFCTRFASGYYSYPVLRDYHRPVYPDLIHPSLYHQEVNSIANRGFAHTAMRYRQFQETVSQLGNPFPWLPFIQNHSNLYADSLGEDDGIYDDDPLREPTAAELRVQANIALASGADGVMFYYFISSPWTTSEQFWPPDYATWVQDAQTGPRDFDPNAGVLGFVDAGLEPRRCDWNGESKWDSAATYIHDFLLPIGQYVKDSLTWKQSRAWNLRQSPDSVKGINDWVNEVLSQRQDQPDPIDQLDSTFVLVTEFQHRDRDDRYLLVVNCRTHPTEGHRHITVKLGGEAGTTIEYKVTKILGPEATGDVWIVRPTSRPDTTTCANGFTDYFEPGMAALYKLDAIQNETTSFAGACLAGNLFVEPAATLRTYATDSLSIRTGKGIHVEGELYASGTVFLGCNLEGYWDGLLARNGGLISLDDQCSVVLGRMAAGPNSQIFLDGETLIEQSCDTCSVITIAGGSIKSKGTIVQVPYAGKYLSMYSAFGCKIENDSVQTVAPPQGMNNDSWGINMSGGNLNIRGLRLLDTFFGLSIRDDGVLTSGDMNHWGKNRIHAKCIALGAYSEGQIEFGVDDYWAQHSGIGKWGKCNAVNIEDTTQWSYHAWNDNAGLGGLWADSCYWSKGPAYMHTSMPVTYGWVSTRDPLAQDPVPLTGSQPGLSKTNAIHVPPPNPNLKILLMRAASSGRAIDVRNEISSYLLRSGLSATLLELQDAARYCKSYGFHDLRDTLMVMLLARQDIPSKLLFVDLAIEDSLYETAASVLSGYSFAGSSVLLRRALWRKAFLYPLLGSGGYQRGLLALDSLKQLGPNDPVFADFIDLYPVLFSRLSPAEQQTNIKRLYNRRELPTLPDGIDVWPNYPNPFRDVTSFTFKLGKATHVRLTVHDAMGREVAVLTDADYTRGVHSVVLQSTQLPSGLYFSRFMSDEGVIQRKMMLVR